MSAAASPKRKRGSVYCGRGVWVSIPLGTPKRPLSDEEIAECQWLLAEGDAKAATTPTTPPKVTL